MIWLPMRQWHCIHQNSNHINSTYFTNTIQIQNQDQKQLLKIRQHESKKKNGGELMRSGRDRKITHIHEKR